MYSHRVILSKTCFFVVTRVYGTQGLNPGAIGGIVVAILVVVSAIMAIVILKIYRNRQVKKYFLVV